MEKYIDNFWFGENTNSRPYDSTMKIMAEGKYTFNSFSNEFVIKFRPNFLKEDKIIFCGFEFKCDGFKSSATIFRYSDDTPTV